MNIEREPQPRHDIYLAGAWERHCKTPFKSIIKEALSSCDIYDPEQYQEGNWFEDDLEAIRDSRCIICYANEIPMSASTFEMGYFYSLQRQREANGEDFGHIILIWESDVQPEFAQKWHTQSGFVVDSVEGAISLYKQLYEED